MALHQVLATFATPDQPVFDLVIEHADGSCETISGTSEHPFLVEDRGWVGLKDLQPGDRLVDFDDAKASDGIASSDCRDPVVWEVILSNRLITVYNLLVEDTHTYLVGVDGVVVHNKCEGADAYRNVAGVYKILKDGKVYIGQSVNIGRRLVEHGRKSVVKIIEIVRSPGTTRQRELLETELIRQMGGPGIGNINKKWPVATSNW